MFNLDVTDVQCAWAHLRDERAPFARLPAELNHAEVRHVRHAWRGTFTSIRDVGGGGCAWFSRELDPRSNPRLTGAGPAPPLPRVATIVLCSFAASMWLSLGRVVSSELVCLPRSLDPRSRL